MKKVLIKTAILSIALVLIATSCKHRGNYNRPAGVTGPAGPSLTGNLEGVVFLYDASGSKILSSSIQPGDSIQLTNNSSGTVLKTTSSSTGTYTFSNITTGTYSMTVTKPGYGSVIAYGIQFAGGGTDYKNVSLSKVPTTNVTTVQAVDQTSNTVNYVTINGTLPTSTENVSVIIYVSVPGNTSVNNTLGNFSASYITSVSLNSTSFSYSIPTSNLYNLGFTSGNTVYLSVYIVGSTGSSYTDPATGLVVYTALSNVPVNTSALVQ